ncbi:MAG TPA: Trm112 family protein [Pirellulales bacterium]|nr:Trm112 family protein [Pirellulales bacterium]
MINKELLDILVCPELRTPLTVADDELLAALNRAVAEGRLKNRGGERVDRPLDGGLVREDREVVYPIQDGIPIMLVDEAIPLSQVTEGKA